MSIEPISLRKKFRIQNTLVCLLRGIVGRRTVVELRNETSVTGRIESVDDCMNTTLSDATFKTMDGHETKFTLFYVQGKNIRYVQIPDQVNMLKTIKWQLSEARGRQPRGFRERKEVQKMMKKQKDKEKLRRRTEMLIQRLANAVAKEQSQSKR